MIYADGSALRLTVADSPPESEAWRAWLAEHEGEVVVSEVGLTSLRRAADPLGREAREQVRRLVPRLSVRRISDQVLPVATLNEPVLGSFAALHLGMAVAEPDVDTVATYERDLARLARMYGLEVRSPGRPDAWWV